MNTFSIIMPAYSSNEGQYHRPKLIERAIRSIVNQQYPHWELIIVDDGSTDETPDLLKKWVEKDKRIKLITHETSMNRAISRNDGMDAATKDWLCWIDSDDEYTSHYLRAYDKMINEFSDYKIFNFSSILYYPNHTSQIRDTFKPLKLVVGHEWFKSGHINTGAFIFKREIWQGHPEMRIPDEASPYAFASESHFDMRFPPNDPKVEFESEKAFTDGKMRVGVSLGNPFGDDFLQFYLLTRRFHSKPLDVALYVIYPRNSENCYEYF